MVPRPLKESSLFDSVVNSIGESAILAACARIRLPSDPESVAVLLNTTAENPGSVRALHNKYEQTVSDAPTCRLLRMIVYWLSQID